MMLYKNTAYLVAPLIACFIASWHFLVLRHPPNNPWKGGGFGMYSAPCNSWRDVWVCQEAEGKVRYSNIKSFDKKYQALLKPVIAGGKAFPNQRNTDKILDEMLALGVVTPYLRQHAFIVVTEIRFDLETGVFTKNVIFNGSQT